MDTVSWLAEEIPEKADVGAGDWRCDVCCSVAEACWKDLHTRRNGEKRCTEWKNTSAVCGRAFWEYDNRLVWMLPDKGLEIDHLGIRWRFMLRMLKSSENRVE